mgnify:CR=1 FL=1
MVDFEAKRSWFDPVWWIGVLIFVFANIIFPKIFVLFLEYAVFACIVSCFFFEF